MLDFSIPEITDTGALTTHSTQAELTALTTAGTPLRGTDSVEIVGPLRNQLVFDLDFDSIVSTSGQKSAANASQHFGPDGDGRGLPGEHGHASSTPTAEPSQPLPIQPVPNLATRSREALPSAHEVP